MLSLSLTMTHWNLTSVWLRRKSKGPLKINCSGPGEAVLLFSPISFSSSHLVIWKDWHTSFYCITAQEHWEKLLEWKATVKKGGLERVLKQADAGWLRGGGWIWIYKPHSSCLASVFSSTGRWIRPPVKWGGRGRMAEDFHGWVCNCDSKEIAFSCQLT